MTESVPLSLRIRADGGLLYLAATYDPALKALIKKLSHRRWDRGLQEWVVPARKGDRRELLRVIALAEEVGVVVEIAPTARPRFDQLGITRIRCCDGNAVELISPYDPDRAAVHRTLPERRFDGERKAWLVPMTRDGAQAVLRLIADHEDQYVSTDAALARLWSAANASSAVPQSVERPDEGIDREHRKSPVAHTRKITRGPIFDARPHDRVLVDGVIVDGVRRDAVPCVLIRVDPSRRRRRRRSPT